MTKDLYLKKMKPLRRNLRKHMTEAEVCLWSFLRKKQLGFAFRRQVSIGHYIVDFYCKELSLAIEVDGSIHNKKSVLRHDEFRQKLIEMNNVQFLRFKNKDIFKKIGFVLKTIQMKCKEIDNFSPAGGVARVSEPRGIKKR